MSYVVYSMCVAYVSQVTDFEKRYFGSTRNVVADTFSVQTPTIRAPPVMLLD